MVKAVSAGGQTPSQRASTGGATLLVSPAIDGTENARSQARHLGGEGSPVARQQAVRLGGGLASISPGASGRGTPIAAATSASLSSWRSASSSSSRSSYGHAVIDVGQQGAELDVIVVEPVHR